MPCQFFDHAGLGFQFPAILPPLPSCGLIIIFSPSMGKLWATVTYRYMILNGAHQPAPVSSSND
eukprot:scaffold23242_cov74-Cyclotella_meneghiniana.AAC.2